MLWFHLIRSLLASPRVVQRRLAPERQDYALGDFVAHFGREPDIAEAIWQSLACHAAVDGFRPKPEDELEKVYGVAEEDLDDLVLGILERCRCRVPPPSETTVMSPIRTVADMFDFAAEMRRPEG